MDLILKKSFTEEKTYQLTLNDVVIATYRGSNVKEIAECATYWAKKYQKNLYLCQSAVGQYFVGFQGSFKNPVIFIDRDFVIDNYKDRHVILEGPFLSEEDAQLFCYNISGEKGDILDLPA